MSDPSPEASPVYRVRFSTIAEREAIAVLLRFVESQGEKIARDWYVGLRSAAATLSENPYRNTVLPRESRLIGQQTRQLLYRRTRESVAYHAFYTIDEADANGPRVIIFHIRHAARRPLSRTEAREIGVAD